MLFLACLFIVTHGSISAQSESTSRKRTALPSALSALQSTGPSVLAAAAKDACILTPEEEEERRIALALQEKQRQATVVPSGQISEIERRKLWRASVQCLNC